MKTIACIIAAGWIMTGAAMAGTPAGETAQKPSWMVGVTAKLEKELGARYGEGAAQRIKRGLRQAGDFWREEDGDAASFEQFARTHFAGDQATLDAMFDRFQFLLEKTGGHLNLITLAMRRQADLDLGPILPFDEIFAGYQPAAHLNDDFFANKLAFVVLLNFPLTTLEQRLQEGSGWSRRQWAEARLAQRFSRRVPAEVGLAIGEASAAADQYIAEYNLWMHHLVDGGGKRLFPAGKRLLSHWNLRDEIKADYSARDTEAALARQRMIQKAMERIVDQTIPAVVVNNPHVDWNPVTNNVRPASAQDAGEPAPVGMRVTGDREPDTRYAVLLKTFHATRMADPYSPTAPTHMERSFNEGREITEERVAGMFRALLTSPLLPRVGGLIRERLGRPLEPFDIWYNGFRQKGPYAETELDERTRRTYPTSEAFKADIPRILRELGFPPERAAYLAANIEVDPARGSGHAWGPAMREASARLRTRVGASGMDYKGYNIAVHELGHNVEQVLSMKDMDHSLLAGVPNTAFTEAMAFVFQAKDLELLGLTKPDERSEAFTAVHDYWATCEIAAVALVDMAVWRWMYAHPDANPAELREATLGIARDIWNTYYAPVIGVKDVTLLGVYSHIIHSFLYLPDYPLGHLIAHQVEEQMRKAGSIGPEVERMIRSGSIAPDLWMERATGAPVGAEAMLAAVERALAGGVLR
ncbi:MAG: hypothetical protein WB626_10620 [Bacteroidota bacterium]